MKIRNNSAAVAWVFSLCFLVVCALFTYILIRDGSSNIAIDPPNISGVYPAWFIPLVLAVFWLAGVGLAIYVSSKPCILVEVLSRRSITIINRYPFRKEVRTIPVAELAPARVIEFKDSEGDTYFQCLISAPGSAVTIAEGPDRAHCESVCALFNNAIGEMDRFA